MRYAISRARTTNIIMYIDDGFFFISSVGDERKNDWKTWRRRQVAATLFDGQPSFFAPSFYAAFGTLTAMCGTSHCWPIHFSCTFFPFAGRECAGDGERTQDKKKKEAIVPSHDLHTFFAPFSQRFHLAPLRHASTRRGAPYTLSVSKTSSGARWIYSTRNFAINIFFFYSSVIFSGFTSFPNRVHWLGWNVIHSIAESKCNIRQEVLVSLAMAKWSYRRRHHRRHLYIQLNTHHSTWWHSDAPKASSSFADKTFSHSISNSKSIIIMAWIW